MRTKLNREFLHQYGQDRQALILASWIADNGLPMTVRLERLSTILRIPCSSLMYYLSIWQRDGYITVDKVSIGNPVPVKPKQIVMPLDGTEDMAVEQVQDVLREQAIRV